MTTPVPEWTYSGDPKTSQLDEVRFLLQDVEPTMPLLKDLEIQYLIDKWAHLYQSLTYVAAVGAAVIARKFAGVVSVTADGVSVNVADLSARYTELAKQLRAEYQAEGAVEGIADLENLLAGNDWDYTIEPLEFGMHLHDNRLAGRQNFGGLHKSGSGYYGDNPLLGGA